MSVFNQVLLVRIRFLHLKQIHEKLPFHNSDIFSWKWNNLLKLSRYLNIHIELT